MTETEAKKIINELNKKLWSHSITLIDFFNEIKKVSYYFTPSSR